MATAKKLPSGSWRCLVYTHTEEILQDDGTIKKKRCYESFTSDDPTRAGKKEAEALAAQWRYNNQNQKAAIGKLTVSDAVRRYIVSKEVVLSPSTIRGYYGYYNKYFKDTEFGREELKKLDDETVQIWVSSLSAKLSPKTVGNIHGLFSSAFHMFRKNFTLDVRLPAKQKPDTHTPTDAEIEMLIKYMEKTSSDRELELAILLAAFGPARRGEVCGLIVSDVADGGVKISKSYVKGKNNEWVLKKTPKSEAGFRTIVYPAFIMKKLQACIKGKAKTERIFDGINPDMITSRFSKILERIGMEHFRYHDLRHYGASIMHALGVPDAYIMERGGWSSDRVMKQIYLEALSDQAAKQNQVINEHFEKMNK